VDKGSISLGADEGEERTIPALTGDMSGANLGYQARMSCFCSAIELDCGTENKNGEDVRLGRTKVRESINGQDTTTNVTPNPAVQSSWTWRSRFSRTVTKYPNLLVIISFA
jgi:hypothetical protein